MGKKANIHPRRMGAHSHKGRTSRGSRFLSKLNKGKKNKNLGSIFDKIKERT